MAYTEKVSALCNELEIPNPILEMNLKISALTFQDGDSKTLFRVEATDMNRAGRLFVEWYAINHPFPGQMRTGCLIISPFLRTVAELFWDELWREETSETIRTIIHGFKKAEVVVIEWK